MDGENNGKSLLKWMIWRYPYFWKHPTSLFRGMDFFGDKPKKNTRTTHSWPEMCGIWKNAKRSSWGAAFLSIFFGYSPNSKPLKKKHHLVQPKKITNWSCYLPNTSSRGVVGSSRGPTNEVVPEFLRWSFLPGPGESWSCPTRRFIDG